MNNLKQDFTNEQTGISYTLAGKYYLPDLKLPEEEQQDIGRFGLMRRHYLKTHRKGLFAVLLTGEKLNAHLYEIDQTANARMELLAKQMASAEGVTEQLKAENHLLWIQKITNIRNRAEEIVREELIYS
ncbi:MAG: TnpV protein [Oscillospiraceae bacterium]|nr:TnpV protein [Oscillospiraceae bacterium]MDD4413464.1 TnpV protein [Oscillospiraceae bacterium]